ncbi:MAG: beta-lactamase family protein [Saprospiraceae bacterium]|nr:beta-lactamase family protein [Saprospiraceae bacterium]
MSRIQWYWIVIVGLIQGVPAGLVAQKTYLENEIRKIVRLDRDIDIDEGSCTVIGVIDGDSTYTYQWGSLARNSDTPVADTSLFPVGGLTHVHLILLTYHMMELGLISPDDTIGKFNFPIFKGSRINALSISDLLSHRTGLPKILPQLVYLKHDPDDEYKDYESQKIDSALVAWTRQHTLSHKHNHSQYNFYLLSKILWLVKDKRVHDNGKMIPEMRHTWFAPLDTIPSQSVPAFYSAQSRLLPIPHFGGLTTTMGMVSCMKDQLIVAEVLMRMASRNDFKQVFLQPVVEKKKKKTSFTNGGLRWSDGGKSGKIYMMTGVLKGSSAFLCVAPQTHTAVIILHNSGESQHVLGFQILRMINYQFTRTY